MFLLLVFGLIRKTREKLWKLILSLNKIVEFVCSQKISRRQILYLDVVCKDYVDRRKKHFPSFLKRLEKNLESLLPVLANTTQQVICFMQLELCKNEELQLHLKKIYKEKDVSGGNQKEVIGVFYFITKYFKNDIKLLYQRVSRKLHNNCNS